MKLMTRVFLVGCPRSGTTLLQSILAAHPHVWSLPETHFFHHLIHRKKKARTLGFANTAEARKAFSAINCRTLPKFPASIFARKWAECFARCLDARAAAEGKNMWMEKTPRHLHSIEWIERYIPAAKFIHVVREGTDTVASLYEVTHKYPEEWGGTRDVERCCRRWVDDVRLSLAAGARRNHRIVLYDELITAPARSVADLCTYLGIPFRQEMLTDAEKGYEKVKEAGAEWTAGAAKQVYSTARRKFRSCLSADEQRHVLDQISLAGLSDLRALLAEVSRGNRQ